MAKHNFKINLNCDVNKIVYLLKYEDKNTIKKKDLLTLCKE